MVSLFSRSSLSLILVPLLASLSACSPPQTPSASLVITGARVWTGDPELPWAEAAAVAGGEILAVGSAADIAPLIGDGTEVIESDGGLLVPGFIDAHVHFLAGGAAIASVQLRDAQTPEEFARRVGAFAETVEPGEWITETWGPTVSDSMVMTTI